MTKTDQVYLNLLRDIICNGKEKYTRSGRVKSVFGRQLRFDLKEGLPLLTTKKVFTKGVIHELLWFLQRPYNSHGSMNIEYLVRNNVHIWDDDAFRWFKTKITQDILATDYLIRNFMICTNDDERGEKPQYEYWIENDIRKTDREWFENITKEEFIDLTIQKVEIWGPFGYKYRFGDLGPIYGKQWRSFGYKGKDQINEIIEKLKTSPNDRRMLCLAFNPDQLDEMALPPCHVMMQFYTRELTDKEKTRELANRSMDDKRPMPKYALSCMWTQRSVDAPLGLVYNILSYSILTHMIAKLVNMVPDELVASLGDTHIYMNQMDGVKEQLSREGHDIIPMLIIDGEQKTINDFKFEDIQIWNYVSDPPIKFPLSVG